MIVQIVRGGSTYAVSGGTDFAGCTYSPRTPEIREQEITTVLRHGGEVAGITRANVVESMRVVVKGSSGHNILQKVRELEGLFPVEDAERTRRTEPVYIQVYTGFVGESGFFRSEILSGRVEWSERPQGRLLESGAVEILIVFKRRWYWEAVDEVEATDGAVSVDNHAQPLGVATNRLSLDGARIDGVIPAACRIEIENNTGGGIEVGEIYIGHAAFVDTDDHAHQLDVSGTGIVDASSSGGTYVQTGQIPDFQIAVAGGSWYLPANQRYMGFLRSATMLGDAQIQAKLGQGVVDVTSWAGPKMSRSAQLQKLGSVRWPDVGEAYSTAKYQVWASSVNLSQLGLDFVQLLPADTYLELSVVRQNTTYSIGDGDKIIYDGMARRAYLDIVTSGWAGRHDAVNYQGDILLWPGRDQWLYFLHTEQTGGVHNVDETLGVRVYYRARRLTL